MAIKIFMAAAGLLVLLAGHSFAAALHCNYWSPPGVQTLISSKAFTPADLEVGTGNTAVLAPGTYPGFRVPRDVAVCSETLGTAVVNGTVTASNGSSIVGLTIDEGAIDASKTSNVHILRNSFTGGARTKNCFGMPAICYSESDRVVIDHNLFKGAAINAYDPDNAAVTYNDWEGGGEANLVCYTENGHSGYNFSYNTAHRLSSMFIEVNSCGSSNATYDGMIIHGNWAGNFAWTPTSKETVIYSVVDRPKNAQITDNTGLGPGNIVSSIGIELSGSGLIMGNRIRDVDGSCVEIYGQEGANVENNNFSNCGSWCKTGICLYRSSSAGTRSNNTDSLVHPLMPATGPSARSSRRD